MPAPKCQVGDWGEWSGCKSPKGACIARESKSYVRSEEERKLETGEQFIFKFEYLIYRYTLYLLLVNCSISNTLFLSDLYFSFSHVRVVRIFFSGRQRMKSSMQHKRELLAHREECLTENSCPELQVPPSSFDVTPCVDGEHLS